VLPVVIALLLTLNQSACTPSQDPVELVQQDVTSKEGGADAYQYCDYEKSLLVGILAAEILGEPLTAKELSLMSPQERLTRFKDEGAKVGEKLRSKINEIRSEMSANPGSPEAILKQPEHRIWLSQFFRGPDYESCAVEEVALAAWLQRTSLENKGVLTRE
jgi:hypothetical protein